MNWLVFGEKKSDSLFKTFPDFIKDMKVLSGPALQISYVW